MVSIKLEKVMTYEHRTCLWPSCFDGRGDQPMASKSHSLLCIPNRLPRSRWQNNDKCLTLKEMANVVIGRWFFPTLSSTKVKLCLPLTSATKLVLTDVTWQEIKRTTYHLFQFLSNSTSSFHLIRTPPGGRRPTQSHRPLLCKRTPSGALAQAKAGHGPHLGLTRANHQVCRSASDSLVLTFVLWTQADHMSKVAFDVSQFNVL